MSEKAHLKTGSERRVARYIRHFKRYKMSAFLFSRERKKKPSPPCSDIHFLLCKAAHRRAALKSTPLNYPDGVRETLSWLQVALWYKVCWPFPDHIGWLYACRTAVWQERHKRLWSNGSRLFQTIHPATTRITLCSAERWAGTCLTLSHTRAHTHACTG